MCCIVAFDPNKRGCFAIRKKSEGSWTEFWDELNQLVGHKPIQIVAISRPSAYLEYAPYHMIESENEFIQKVKEMLDEC